MSVAGDLQVDENEDVLSMVDVLQDSAELEEEATAVLGDSDDKCCTYPLGHRARQALYSCVTCTTPATEPAGVCLACSYECHEGHQLYELYTKRNFRCDCGNSKFGSMRCTIFPDKAPTNPDNKYNQNYLGVYCTCSRPYPDPDDEIEDEMIQCVICEDWFHGRHLGVVSIPDSTDYQEMVCSRCMEGPCHFLWFYSVTGSQEVKIESEDSAAAVDVACSSQDDTGSREDTKDIVASEQAECSDTQQGSTANSGPLRHTDQQRHSPAEKSEKIVQDSSINEDGLGSSSPRHQSRETASEQTGGVDIAGPGSAASCYLKELKLRLVETKSQATFWPSQWRTKLCTCEDCQAMYRTRNLLFLLDNSDTMAAYEERGKIKNAGSLTSQYAMGMEALASLNRVKQVEVLHEFNDLKSSLSEYLQSFANAGKIVKRQDIDDFFTDMQSRKRQRVGEAGGLQHFCR